MKRTSAVKGEPALPKHLWKTNRQRLLFLTLDINFQIA